MRFVVCALACVGAGGLSLALADPPATPSAPSATATQAPSATPTTPAQPAAAASTPSAPAKAAKDVVVEGTAEEDNLEKHFLAEGYKMEMHHGEKYFCRREQELGSRLGGMNKTCGTAQQLQATEREAKAAVQRGVSQQVNPTVR
jgi:hypothetical protein